MGQKVCYRMPWGEGVREAAPNYLETGSLGPWSHPEPEAVSAGKLAKLHTYNRDHGLCAALPYLHYQHLWPGLKQ